MHRGWINSPWTSSHRQASTQQTTEQKTETTKVEGAPEKYELKPPEGQTFDDEFVKVYSETAKELDLSQEKAQKLIDKVSPVIAAQQKARIDAVRAGWEEASKTDAEFGGAKLEENLAVAKTAVDQFASPALKTFLKESGLGNHPEMIRTFFKVGKALSSDGFVGGHKEGNPGPKTFADHAETLYGKA